MEIFWILWPAIGILSAIASTPKSMFDRRPSGHVLAFFCGAIVGPFGLLWFFIEHDAQ